MNKKRIVRLVAELLLVIFAILVFILVNERIIQNRISSFYLLNDGDEYAYQIEEAFVEDNYLIIKGWFFELRSIKNVERGVNEDNKLEVLLYNLSSETEKDMSGREKPQKGIKCDISYYDRNDVNQYFDCKYDYSHCGFVGKIKINQLNLYDTEYQIIFKTDGNSEYGVGSKYYIIGGELCNTTYSKQISLDVAGTDLEKIIKDGTYVGGNINRNVYVFQHGWQLYFIVSNDDFFDAEGNTYIEYMLDTTQFDKLPPDRTEKGWYWSNLGGNFEDYEITDTMNCGKYRVAVRDIPKEYSVTRISTGQYEDGQWIWQSIIRPIYNFEGR